MSELDEIRARDKAGLTTIWDTRWLLAEVTRLLADNGRLRSELGNLYMHPHGSDRERLRILHTIEELPEPKHDQDWGTLEENGWNRAISDVLRAINE